MITILRVVRPLWGGMLLAAPGRALGFPDPPSRAVSRVVRIIGLRQLIEATLTARDGEPPRWAAPVDLLHAASMVALAVLVPPLRRQATRSALAASLIALLEV